MENTTLMLLKTIIELVIDHGVPMALKLIKAWDVDDPTIEDILKLKHMAAEPEEYFK